jgi:DNA-binding transcriptional ArsR family regulator
MTTEMSMSNKEFTTTEEFLPLFKALADKNRLKIVGLLSQQPHAVEDLAATLKLGMSTVSHHLSVLSKANLVTTTTEGYYSFYSLETGILQETAKRLLKQVELKYQAEETTESVYEKKILSTFTTPDGRIKSFPMQEKKFLVLVRYVCGDFKYGIKYTEKQMNQMLFKFSKDTARLRRALVDYGYMHREGGGGRYWRVDAVVQS